MSDGFGCGDTLAQFELFELVAQLVLLLKLNLLVLDLSVKDFESFNIESVLNIDFKGAVQKLSQILIFSLRKRDLFCFHQLDEFPFSGALPGRGACQHFVGDDANRVNVRFV
jgi:hypothetical protein